MMTPRASISATLLVMTSALLSCADSTAPVVAPIAAPAPVAVIDVEAVYGECEPGEGGSGKTYMGREIAEVMGHTGLDWLERTGRAQEERTDLLLGLLPLRPTDAVADIGAGSGYFTMRLAPLVPEGVVYATDIQPEMLAVLSERARDEGMHNVMPVLGAIDACGLEPASIDLALFVDAYHEFSHPAEMMRSLRVAMKPNGVVVLVEYRLEDPSVRIKLRHKMSLAQATLEMRAAGFDLVKTHDELPQQHVMLFRPHASK